MRTIRRIALWGCSALLTLTGLIYLGDDLYARLRGGQSNTYRLAGCTPR